jgi:hypothetical protein
VFGLLEPADAASVGRMPVFEREVERATANAGARRATAGLVEPVGRYQVDDERPLAVRASAELDRAGYARARIAVEQLLNSLGKVVVRGVDVTDREVGPDRQERR